jgi:hypothetical protein
MNATYLFQKPLREFHSSESYWSAFFVHAGSFLQSPHGTC